MKLFENEFQTTLLVKRTIKYSSEQKNKIIMSKITIGEKLPEFELLDQNSETISSESLLGKPLVLYFYPKDDTPGCTAEACSFRDNFEDFIAEGAQVVGVSADSPAAHAKFAAKYRLPFTLLSDKGNKLRKTIGVPTNFLGLIPGRVTYIFDAEGVLVSEFNSQFKATQHITEALEQLKQLK